jgi:hypothetical protein
LKYSYALEFPYSKMPGQLPLAIVLLFASTQVMSDPVAENIWLQRDGTSVNVGVYLANYDTTVRKSSDDVLGTRIDLEDDLGMDSDDEVARFAIAVRPWPKHRFFFSYMDMDRNGDQALDEDITFDGITFPAGTQVGSKLDLGMYRGGYTWSFLQNDSWELGLSLGLYLIDLDVRLESTDHQIRADDSTTEAFPMVGFTGTWLVSDDWLISGTAEAFSIDSGNTDGDFYNLRLIAEYAVTEKLSIGAGYDLVSIDAKDTKKNDSIDYEYDGALIFLRWQF